MGMNPRGRSRGRGHNNFNNNRRFNNGPSRNTVYDSIGPAGRLRGTAFQLMEKYQNAAKEMMSSDRVLAENCLQHAEHYMRLNALAVSSETRFNPPNQPAVEINEPADFEQTAQSEPVVVAQPEPVVVAFVAPQTRVKDEKKVDPVEMDLSVPVSVMVENEMKARRGRPVVKKEEETGNAVPVAPKRRGRPPMKKTNEAGT